MHEASVGIPTTINISTIGYCSPTYSSQHRVGKSCLIHRFMNRSKYTEDHLSVISSSDYYGSVISENQWIYWGSRIIQHESKRYRLRIIEQCDFIDDHLFTPFGTEPYINRCFSNIIYVKLPKTAYVCKDQVGNEWNYSREILEPCNFVVDAFVIVLDITLTGEDAILQQKFLKKALGEIRKRKIPFVFASSKHDCEVSSENKEFVKNLLHKVTKSLKKIRCCRVETSARLNVNVHQAFLAAALLCSAASNEINLKYFPYSPPLYLNAQSLRYPDTRFRHSDRVCALVSIYADAHSHPFGRVEFRPPPRLANRISLSENITYDLPVEGKMRPSNLLCCQIPVAISSYSSVNGPLNQSISEAPFQSPCTSHVCYRTINSNSELPPLRLPAPSRPQVAHIIYQPNTSAAAEVAPATPVETAHPFRGTVSPDNSTYFSSKPLLILFLSGPGASQLKGILQRQCYQDRFYLLNGQCFRVWIFDAVDPHTVQISPSKWQPHHTLRQSASVPSAFTTPTQTSFSCTDNGFGDKDDSTDSTPSSGNRQRQLKLNLWVMDMGISGIPGSDKCPPKNIDAVVFRAAADNLPADEYYDEVGGDLKVELKRAVDLAQKLRAPLFCIPEKTPHSLLASLLFFARCHTLFKAIIDKNASSTPTVPYLLPEAQSTVNMSLLMQVCSFDIDAPTAAGEIIKDHSGLRFGHTEKEEEEGDEELQRSMIPPSNRSSCTQAFQMLPRVAIGLDYSNAFATEHEDRTKMMLSPLVAFVTICQALDIFAQLPPVMAEIRFALFHFLTPQWLQLCGDITAQLEALLTVGLEHLVTRADCSAFDDHQLVIMLVALSSADSTRPRQLITGLAAQQTCPIWHPRIPGPCLPRCLLEGVQRMREHIAAEPSNIEKSAGSLKPSLAFLHIQSENDREFELYRQLLNGDMSSWFLSYSTDFSLTTNSTAIVEGRCSRGDNCEMCQGRHFPCQHQQQHQSPVLENPWTNISNCYSPQCCATAMAGISDEDYVDASYRFPVVNSTAIASIIAPSLSASRPPPLLRRFEEDEQISEYYTEFNSLFNEAANHHPRDSIVRLNRPHRPQAPTLAFSPIPLSTPFTPVFSSSTASPSLSAATSSSSFTSIASFTLSSLINSYTSSSPDRGVIDLRPQGGLIHSCSDTNPICSEKLVVSTSNLPPIPVTSVYKSSTETVIGWHKASAVEDPSPPPVRRSGRSWVPVVGCFCAPSHTSSVLKSEFVELMDTLSTSASAVPPSFDPYGGEGTIRSTYGIRRSIPTLIDSRRKNNAAGQTYSVYSRQNTCDKSMLTPTTPLYSETAVGGSAREGAQSKGPNKFFGGWKSAFRRRSSLFRSHNRKNNAKH